MRLRNQILDARYWLVVIAIVAIGGCAAPPVGQKPGEKMELGWIDRSVLHAPQYPAFDTGYVAYKPALEMLNDVRPALDSVRFLVVLGTWCSDSKREVPRFFKIIDSLHVPKEHVQLYAVDRTKQHPEGIPQQYNIKKVPTFIMLHNGTEAGRIVESPKTTIEQDLFEILLPV